MECDYQNMPSGMSTNPTNIHQISHSGKNTINFTINYFINKVMKGKMRHYVNFGVQEGVQKNFLKTKTCLEKL